MARLGSISASISGRIRVNPGRISSLRGSWHSRVAIKRPRLSPFSNMSSVKAGDQPGGGISGDGGRSAIRKPDVVLKTGAPMTLTGSGTGAMAFIKACAAAGITACFANPGTTEMFFVGALDATPSIRPVLGLHETVVTGAVDGYGRMTGKPALALLHLGPGLANGLANLHNARRAGSPAIVVVGEMSEWHRGMAAPLEMDIQALAATVSKTVITTEGAGELAAVASRAARESLSFDAVAGSRVVTVIVPHNHQFERTPPAEANGRPSPAPAHANSNSNSNPAAIAATRRFVADVAAALRSTRRGKSLLLLGQRALCHGGLESVGRIAAATGAELYAETWFPRLERGVGSPPVRRLPYFPADAKKVLEGFDTVVLCDAAAPVAMFGYETGPRGPMLPQPGSAVWDIDCLMDAPAVLRMLVTELNAPALPPAPPPRRPERQSGRLTAAALGVALARTQPESAIVCDESLTSGTSYWEASAQCPAFTHLMLTGGAIGSGPCLAVGAAVGAPGRRVINFQSDGAGLFSAQALWTQARERLPVTTIICSNRSYQILKLEHAMQKVGAAGAATRALTELSDPSIDWVKLAEGYGVPAARATTAEELEALLAAAFLRPGPFLIEALLVPDGPYKGPAAVPSGVSLT